MPNLYEHIFEETSVPAYLAEVWTPKVTDVSFDAIETKSKSPNMENIEQFISRTVNTTGLGTPRPHGIEGETWISNSDLPNVTSAVISKHAEYDEDVIKEIVASKTRPEQRDGYTQDVYPGPVMFPDMFFPESISSDKVDEAKGFLEKLTASVEVKPSAKSVNYKFDEDEYIAEALAYITSTYDGHYSSKKSKYKGHDTQATEVIFAADLGVGFCAGDIIKYAARLGKKDGYNRKDVLKIIHYATMLLHVLDNTETE